MLFYFNSILLDDVLAAVDSHVARHVFGRWPHSLPSSFYLTIYLLFRSRYRS